MRTTIHTSMLLALALAVGCGSSETEPGATTETHDREVPGTHASTDLDPLTAQRWIDEVRLGNRVGDDGAVVGSEQPARFTTEDPIHMSMRVDDAPAGSVVRVIVYDAEHNEAWGDERAVVEGEPYLMFTIDRDKLEAGEEPAPASGSARPRVFGREAGTAGRSTEGRTAEAASATGTAPPGEGVATIPRAPVAPPARQSVVSANTVARTERRRAMAERRGGAPDRRPRQSRTTGRACRRPRKASARRAREPRNSASRSAVAWPRVRTTSRPR